MIRRRKPATIPAAAWVRRWSVAAGVASAELRGIGQCGRAWVHYVDRGEPQGVAVLTASDVAEVIGQPWRRATFGDDGELVLADSRTANAEETT